MRVFLVISFLIHGALSETVSDPIQSYDTIIVGLGASGCAAASKLAQAGKKVLGLEAEDRLGGRVKTVPFGNGFAELGAAWIHGTNDNVVYQLAVQNNISIIPQYSDFQVYQSDGSQDYRDLIRELTFLALGAQLHPPVDPEPLGQFLKRMVTEYLKEKYPKVLDDQEFLDDLFHALDLVIDNCQGSKSWNDASTHTKFELFGGHQFMSLNKLGYHTLFELLLKKKNAGGIATHEACPICSLHPTILHSPINVAKPTQTMDLGFTDNNTYKNGPGYPNLVIKLNTEVTRIQWSQEPNGKVKVVTKNGATYAADNVIVTVSVGVLKERHAELFTPALPKDKETAIDNIAMGVVGKVYLSFPIDICAEKTESSLFFWKKQDSSREGPIWGKVTGASCPMEADNIVTVWMPGAIAATVETLPDEEVKTKAMDILRKFLGKKMDIPEPTGMVRSMWHSNPFTRGSYTYDDINSPQHPNAREDLAAPLLDSAGISRVLFAGEATNNIHYSTVHGAVETGYREASRILTSNKV